MVDKKEKKNLEDSVKSLAEVIDPRTVSHIYKQEEKILLDQRNGNQSDLFIGGAKDMVEEDILDTLHPVNNPRYLRLLLAVFGFSDLEKKLASVEENQNFNRED